MMEWQSMAGRFAMRRGRSALMATVLATAACDVSAVVLDTPTVFAPGVISGALHDTAPAFTPDGDTVYFSRSNTRTTGILVSHRVHGRWTTPTIAPFSGVWNDQEPTMSPDGRFLVFVSNRPLTDGGPPLDGYFNGKVQAGQGGHLWRIDRRGRGWSTPVHLDDVVNANPSTYAPTISGDGSLTFMQPDATTKRFRLFHARWVAGRYETPEPLSFSTGAETDVDPAIAPDESFIVFGSGRKPARDLDLFVAFRHDGAWDTPIHLGDVVNAPGSDAEARLGPDATTLYFSSERLRDAPAVRDAHTTQRIIGGKEDWNNGLYNIWTTSLKPLIDCVRSARDDAARAACRVDG